MNPLKRLRRALSASVSRRARPRRRLEIESLEQRLVLSGSLSINSVAITLNTPGPTSVSGTLNPGDELAAYRIDGTAGEQLQFHSVSTSSTSGAWELIGENNQEVAGTSLGSDFTADLMATGPYYLELSGNTTTAIDYSFQITDSTTYPPIASSGFNTAQSGTLANNASTTFTFEAPAGLPVYFNNLGFSEPIYATLTDPSNKTIFSQPSSYGNAGPYVLTASGTYTLTLDNTSGASGTYDFNLLSLPSAATSLALGPTQTVSGTLSSGTTTAVYSFLGAASERIFLDNQDATGASVNLQLIGPDNGTIFNLSSSNDSGPLSLTENGTYYLLVEGSGSAATNYQFRLTDTAYSPLTFGSTVDGTVTNANQSDVYSFTGTAGEQTYFEFLNESNGVYGSYWYLYGPNNAYITGSGYAEDFAATLPAAGNYTLVVDNNSSYSTGTYSFEAIQNVNPTSALTLGTEVTGTIANPGDAATYTFTGTAGQRIYYDGLASASPDLYAELTDPLGNPLFINSSTYDELPLPLSYSGTYTLTISSNGASRATGAYAFTLDDASTAPSIALTPGSGTTESGTLATGLSTNLYQFSGTAGQSLYFEGLKDSPSSGSLAYLYNPVNGTVTDFYLDSGYDAHVTLPSTGTYLLAVAGQSATNTSVSYSFEVFDNVNPTSTLTLGTPVSGTLTNLGDEATYTFTGSSGQTIYFNSLERTTYIYAVLTSPNGNQIFASYLPYGNQGPYTLNQAGTYTLTLSTPDNQTGNYAFSLDDASTATSIALTPGSGTTETGTLATGLSTNLYQFSGTAGQSIFFQGLSDSPSNGSYATLYNPTNGYVTAFYLESDTTAKLPYTGTYLLAVAGQSASNSSVSYSFEVFDNVNPTSTLTLGTPVSGTLTNLGDEATYTFTGSPGQTIYFNSLESTTYIYAVLTSPYGNQIFATYLPYGNQGPYTLNQAGTYTLTLSTPDNQTGNYAFTLDDTSKATTIALTPGSGTTESGTLATGLSTNLYQFSGTAGERIYFQGQLDSPSSSAVAYLYDPENSQIAGVYLENNEQWTLPSTGTYLLAVAGQSASNSSVSYSFEAFDNVNTTSPLTLGDDVAGTLTNPGDEASYTFTGSAGQNLFFDGLSASSEIEAELYNPSGSPIFIVGASGDDGPYTLSEPGTYTVIVYGSGASTGSYDFRLLDTSAQTLTPTSTPTTVSGTITPGTGTNIYRIAGTAGEQITLHSDSFSSTSGHWYLYNPNNSYVAYAAFGSSFSAPVTLTLNGPYELALQGSDTTDSSVTYQFDISATTPASVTPSGFGTVQSGTLDAGASTSFTFTAPAGSSVYFNNLSRSSQPITATFTDPSNTTIFSYSPYYNAGPYVLTASGTYTLTLTNTSSSSSGTYDFNMLDLPASATALTLGSTVSGTLSSGTNTVVYSFAGTAGQNLFLDNQTTYPDAVNLLLIDPYNNTLFNISSSSDYFGPLTLSATGTYYVLVDGESTSSVNYQFRLTDTSTNPLAFNTTINGTVTNAYQSDVYSFSGTAGEQVYFQYLSDSNGYYGASWYLYGPNNAYITSNYIGAGLSATLLTNGNYTLVVDNSSYSTATYSFEAFQNVNPTSTLTLGTEVSGTIGNPGDSHTYTFTGTAGQQLFYDGLASASPYLYAELTGPYGNNLFNNTSTYDEGPLTLSYSGTYTLTIYSYSTYGAAGAYAFTLYDASTATSVTPGTVVTGTLATGLSTNLYQFSGTAGQSVYFESLGNSPLSSAYATVYNQGNGAVTSFYLDGNGYDASVKLPSTGTYLLAVAGQSASNSSVSYSFEVFDNVNPTSTLTLGTEVTGTIANPGDAATYTFTGTAGQRLYYNALASSSTYVFAELTDPYGNAFFNTSASSDEVPLTLTWSGTYTLTIYSYSTTRATGAYAFSLDDASTATSITLTAGSGTTESGTLATGLSTNLYQFSGTAGQSLYFEGLKDSPSYGAYATLYTPTNGYVTAFYLENDTTATLPSTGTYILAVAGVSASNSSVSYSFEVFDNVNPTSTLTLGTPVSGTLTNLGDEATYTFTGSSGQTIYLDSLERTTYIYAVLTSPYGTQVFATYLPYGNQGPYTLNQAGTYTLTLSTPDNQTGNYAFSLDDTSKATTIALTPGSGTTESGTLATGLTTNLYQFTGTKGELVYFAGLSDSPSQAAIGYIYSPSNSYVTDLYVENDTQVTLPLSGTYILAVVGPSASNSSVSYSFELYDNLAPSSPLALSSEVTGTLTNPGDEASYTFTGSIGQQVLCNGLEPGSLQIAYLYDPEGNQVLDSYLENNAGPITLTTPGTYKLVVTTDGPHTGNYDFRLLDLQSEPKLQVNTTEADLTVTLSAPSTEQVLVQYSTADGTATAADGDYKPSTGLLLFAPGQTTATVEVQAINNPITSSSYFDVNLSNPVDATIATDEGTGVVTINTSAVAPAVTSLSPTSGPAAGGTPVTITGTGFTGATGVDFGTTVATGVAVLSNTTITADSPAGTGVVDVTVTTPGGTSATSSADQFTYVVAPAVTSLSPTSGPAAGGTPVTITGTGFTGATGVDFGTTVATGVAVLSNTTITADSPAGTGVVDVTVTTPGGTSATSSADQFTYVVAPAVTSLSPTSGPAAGGTPVTITGTGFTGATGVDFGTTVATGVAVLSNTTITADSPAGTGVVDVTVTTPGGTSATSSADQFTYVVAPAVTSLSPTSGPAAGGTPVTITGTGFTGATGVDFGTTVATGVAVLSNTTITADSPAGTGVVDVTVTTPGGTSATSSADQFTYVVAPAVTSLSPTSGPAAGGTPVTITGTGFTGATGVDFGTTVATDVAVLSNTTITADSPAGTGVVDVTVTTPGGTSATSSADQFTYVVAPAVTSLSPTSGPAAGGTPVTITGTGFTGATGVDFGTTVATGVAVLSNTTITADSPAGTGVVDVTVTTPGGTSATSSTDQFTYVVAPAVTSLSPTSGPAAGGTPVTITGTGFTGATGVDFGTTVATGVAVLSNTTITADSPAGTGVVDVTVTTPGGTSATSSADQFTYVVAPAVTSLSPTSGPAAGGTPVTITGTGFTGATGVDFGTTVATDVAVLSNTTITADSPAGTGVVDVTVTTPGGTSATSSTDQFTYVVAPTASKLAVFQQPSNATAGVAISPAMIVYVEDQFGNLVTTNTSTITIAVASGPSTTFDTHSTLSVAAIGGKATFSKLILDTAGSYTLSAADGSLAGAISSSFTVAAAAASKLAITTQPSNVAAGAAISPAITVAIQDKYGNLATTNSSTVTVAVASGPGTTFDTSSKQSAAASGGIAILNNVILDKAGSYTLKFSDGALTAATSSASGFTVSAAAASKLAITQQPSNVTAGAAISPAITVAVQDQYGNTVTTDSSTVTVAVATGPTTSFDTASTQSAAASSGIATLNNVILDKAGSYTLKFSDGALTAATSSSFTVSAAAASQLGFVNQPSNATAGAAISPAVTVAVQDQYGNTATTNTSTITIAVATGPPSTTFDATSKLSVSASGGIATFSKLILDTAGSYILSAADGSLAGATSSSFTVGAAAASKLFISTQPTSVTAGVAISPAITVAIQDKYGNLASTNSSPVTITVASGPTTSFAASSVLKVAASAGIATFSNLILDTAGIYMLKASDGALTAATSSASGFTVSAAAASKLAITTQPSNVTAGVAISPAITVAVQDQYGNTVTTDSSTVTVAVATGPTTSFDTASTQSAAASSGIATLNNVILDKAGSYTLKFSDGALTAATSSSFTVSAAAASQLGFVNQPSNATAGAAISPAVTVAVQDQYGNTATTNTSTITIAVASGPSTTFDATSKLSVSASGGIATFSKLILDTAGSYILSAADGSLAGATSSSFTVGAAAASKLFISTQPTSVTAGVAISPAITVAIQDKYGNLASTNSSPVTITVASGPTTSFAASSVLKVAASAGIATFSNLILDTAGIYMLKASDGALTAATSSASGFTVSPAPASQLVFITQPSTTVHGLVITPAPQVAVEDQFGNIETTDNSTQVLVSGSNLTGTTTVMVVNGIATFNDLIITVAGKSKLTASKNGLTSATSVSFTVT